MCCEDEVADFPAVVAQMVASARQRLRSPQSWGADVWNSAIVARPLHHAGDAALETLWSGFADDRVLTTQDVAAALVGASDLDAIPGLVRLSLSDAGVTWNSHARAVAAVGVVVDVPVLVSCVSTVPVRVSIGDESLVLSAGEHALLEDHLHDDARVVVVEVDGAPHASPDAVERVAGAVLRLTAEATCRWSVTDDDGAAHFPHGALRKWDVHGRGYAHGDDLQVVVPPGEYRVRAVRGAEYVPHESVLRVKAGGTADVVADLVRRFDPHAEGWWSADLHVHANYGGEHAVGADHAMAMQRGEGLDLMNLVAANQLTAHVHDVGLFRAALDHQLPGSNEMPAHAGLEYRNDLYGHVHVTGARRDVGRYQTGHAQGAVSVDVPFNHEAAADFRSVGAVVGYCHPVFPVWGEAPQDVLERVMGRTDPRNSEARCSVLDATLGVVDSVDVLSNADDLASAELYRRMVGAGLRVAATAGSDAMLSLRHMGVHSNPPGWVRMYARTGDSVSLGSLQAAIRAGRTVATNGPWLMLDVDGHGPGDDLDVVAPTTVLATVRATTEGPFTVRLHRGSDLAHEWHVAEGEATHGWSADVRLPVTSPDAVTAELVGGADPLVLDDFAYAHSSPVHLVVAGQRVRRADDVDWCLLWLERLRVFVAQHGRGVHEHLARFDAEIDAARSWLRRPPNSLE
ncbi:CehA/McbA family metallohydrolase [Kineosporia sp. A_224]|uniref:CehA/McbA family metallohydrolase n=1 Tax=Kineosporia sp. A_224 TaxID=1962180 RepID=UPI0013046F24|nr:CehA/McbA family metallohydrolase [Kineosporia sp. A_224]